MNRNMWRALMLVFLVGLLAAIVLPVLAQPAASATAGAATTVDASTVPDMAATFLTPVLQTLAGKYGWVAKIIMIVGILRLVMKPIMMIVEAVVANNPTEEAAVQKFEAGPIFKWLSWGLDWLGSVKSVNVSTTNPLVQNVTTTKT